MHQWSGLNPRYLRVLYRNRPLRLARFLWQRRLDRERQKLAWCLKVRVRNRKFDLKRRPKHTPQYNRLVRNRIDRPNLKL